MGRYLIGEIDSEEQEFAGPVDFVSATALTLVSPSIWLDVLLYLTTSEAEAFASVIQGLHQGDARSPQQGAIRNLVLLFIHKVVTSMYI